MQSTAKAYDELTAGLQYLSGDKVVYGSVGKPSATYFDYLKQADLLASDDNLCITVPTVKSTQKSRYRKMF